MCSPSLVEIRPLWASGVLEDADPPQRPSFRRTAASLVRCRSRSSSHGHESQHNTFGQAFN